MTGKRVTAQRRERIEAMTDRQRSAFLLVPYWKDVTGPGYDPDAARDDAIAERDAWDDTPRVYVPKDVDDLPF